MPGSKHAVFVAWWFVAWLALLATAPMASADGERQLSRLALQEHQYTHPLVQLLSAIRENGPTSACPPSDRWLPRQPVDRTKRYLFASTLVNADNVLPQIITQLVPTLLTFRTSHVHVSIYESGSWDNTREWLQILRQLLDSLRIANTIVTDGIIRDASDRIEFLSKIRNLALAPMFPPASPSPTTTTTAASARKVASSHTHIRSNGSPTSDPTTDPAPDEADTSPPTNTTTPSPFRADHVVFFNDVVFCAQDVLRLLQHAPSTDIACGLDLQNWAGSASLPATNFTHLASIIPPRMPPVSHGLRRYLLGAWQQRFTPTDQPHPIKPLQFYDAWVAHDLDGRGLRVEFPYATVPASRERSARGLPFPAQCCWNGLAVLRAAPLHAGLRFRSHVEGECYESECALLCDDYWRTGYGRVLVDPSVRVTYCPSLYPFAHATDRPVASWRQVLADPVNWAKVNPPNRTECCEGSDWADCRNHFPWLDRNYTDVAVRSGFAPSDVCYAIGTDRNRCPKTALTAAAATPQAAAQGKPARRAAGQSGGTGAGARQGAGWLREQRAALRGGSSSGWVVDRRRRLLHGMTGMPR